jgi:hypothetical protein
MYFDRLERVLTEQKAVLAVDTHPLTRNVIIHCRRGFDLADLNNPFLRLDIVSADPASDGGERPQHTLAQLDSYVRMLSGGEMNLALMVVKLFVALVTRQLGAQLLEWGIEAALRALIRSGAESRLSRRTSPVSNTRPLLRAA